MTATAVSANPPPPPSIFKAYDIRGIVGETLTVDLMRDIGRALGSEARAAGESHLFIGRDGRRSGPVLREALVAGLLASGCDVTDVGCIPTPVLYFAASALGSGSGAMLTGSHNPPDYNGLKMVLAGDTLANERIQRLRQRIEARDFTSGAGNYAERDVVPAYIERITGDVRLARPLRVVVDCGNGAAGEAAPRLLRALGCDVVELYCDIDGNFPNHHPDPSQPENLADLRAAVRREQADLGLAFDGDGDRLGVVTARGDIIWPDRQMMLYARDVLARNPGAEILFDIKCTANLADSIAADGGQPVMFKTGHSLIKAEMKRRGVLLAGEMSGHIFFKERWYGFDDALYTAARLLEILSKERRPLQEVFAALPDAVNTPELRLEMREGDHFRFMDQLREAACFDDAKVCAIDGIRADFADGWGLVRASNTTPCLVLRFEGDDQVALERIQTRFRQLLWSVDARLQLPF